MGKHRSSDSESDYSRSRKSSKKKRKRGRRSRSSSYSDSDRHSSSYYSKSSKKKHSSRRSRSPSAEKKRSDYPRQRRSPSGSYSRSSRRRSRSRSSSRDKYSSRRGSSRSRSRSRDRKTSRKSRSPSSRYRRSRSTSRDRSSRSKDYSSSRQRTNLESDRDSARSSPSESKRVGSSELKGPSVADQVPGFQSLTPAQQAEERMRLALKAAATADEKLRESAAKSENGNSSPASLMNTQAFAKSLASIESDSFVAGTFKSSNSKANKIKEEPIERVSHDNAIFGSLSMSGFTLQPDPDSRLTNIDADSIIHPSLFCDPEDKMDKWIERLTLMRKRKLEGDAIQ